MKRWNPQAPTALPEKKQINWNKKQKQTIPAALGSWGESASAQVALFSVYPKNNREMGRDVFLQVHCGHCPRMRCLICARPCCCACLWALDMCTAAWIIEASHAVRVQQALLALALSFPQSSFLPFSQPFLSLFLSHLHSDWTQTFFDRVCLIVPP